MLKVRAPDDAELAQMKPGAVLVGMLNPFDAENNARMAVANVTAFALEAAPRTTRAQSMDVLSSQANIAGYKAVLVAAHHYQRFMPMLMTAAGTVKAARVLILGAGVAGLQAIATAKRLGAVIEASDVRPAVKEQIESLGGKFLDVPFLTDEEREIAQGVGGYARPMPPDWMTRQAELVHQRAIQADIVITTALIPGRNRRLQGRAGGRAPLPALHADADDRRRYRQGCARADPGRRRRRPAGDRHRQAAGRGDRSVRRPSRSQGADRIAGRQVPRRAVPDRRRARDRAGRGRLCARAQSMDVLSSQANIAGYKAVLVAAHHYQRFMPMLMTAAGTVKAARVLILGAGVAGLQAIATAKRLGAVIEAAADASALYARNVLDFLKLVVDKDGQYTLNLEDDIVAACLMTRREQLALAS